MSEVTLPLGGKKNWFPPFCHAFCPHHATPLLSALNAKSFSMSKASHPETASFQMDKSLTRASHRGKVFLLWNQCGTKHNQNGSFQQQWESMVARLVTTAKIPFCNTHFNISLHPENHSVPGHPKQRSRVGGEPWKKIPTLELVPDLFWLSAQAKPGLQP